MSLRIPNYIKRIIFISIIIYVVIFFGSKIFELDSVRSILGDTSVADLNGLKGEIVGGITTSVIIFIFLLLVKPSIEISKKISKVTKDGTDTYTIKMYNSGFLPIYDVRASLVKISEEKTHLGKKNMILEGIDIGLPYIEYLPSMCNVKAHFKGKLFAVQHVIEGNLIDNGKPRNEDITKVLSDNKSPVYYRLTISCQGGFTGMRRILSEDYTYISSLKEGEFKSGATFVIK